MTTTLRWLEPNRRFRVKGSGQTGYLIKVNECRALVKFDDSNQDGSISPGTEVDPLEMQPETPKIDPEKPKEPTPPANPLGKCLCGCGDKTSGSKFRPGHDARFHGRVKRLKSGKLTMEDLQKEIGEKNYALPAYEIALKSHK